MALGSGFLVDLIELKQAGALEGFDKVVEIGAQQLADTFLVEIDRLDMLYRMFGRTRPELGKPSGNFQLSQNAPSSRTFWEALGVSYTAIEFGGHRDSVALDLNRDVVPRALQGAFQLVVNAGTTQHVVNQDNAFRVMHDLACKRGVIYHDLPVFQLDHGMFNYNPRFFWRLRDSNDYGLLGMKVCSWGEEPVPEHIMVDNMRFGGGEQHMRAQTLPNLTIRVALRRRSRQPFVSPLDLPDELMSKRRKRMRALIRRMAFWR